MNGYRILATTRVHYSAVEAALFIIRRRQHAHYFT